MATVRTPIPRKMRVGNKQYSVEIVEAMIEKKRMGHVHYPTQTIKLGLRSNVTNKKYAESVLQDTFWHELTHAILHDMGRDTLNRDEKFVTEFAHRLAKAIRTARF